MRHVTYEALKRGLTCDLSGGPKARPLEGRVRPPGHGRNDLRFLGCILHWLAQYSVFVSLVLLFAEFAEAFRIRVGALRPQQTDCSRCAKRKQDPDSDANDELPMCGAEHAVLDFMAA